MPADKDIAEYLEDQARGTVGTNIFVRFMPDSPDNCIVVTQTQGKPPERTVNIEYPNVQIRVRNTDSDTARTNAENVYDDLHYLAGATIETRIYSIFALGSPTCLGRDVKNREIWSMNFETIKDIE